MTIVELIINQDDWESYDGAEGSEANRGEE